jgi:hypothetical protein
LQEEQDRLQDEQGRLQDKQDRLHDEQGRLLYDQYRFITALVDYLQLSILIFYLSGMKFTFRDVIE